MNRDEVVDALRATGYTGPVSYTKARLEEMLLSRTNPAPVVDTPPELVPGHETGSQRRPRGRQRGASVPPDRFDRVQEWEGLDPTREFKVRGESGWFRFIAHVTNPETGDSWVDAFGGTSTHKALRSFKLERVKTDRRSTRRARTKDGDHDGSVTADA